MIWLLKLPDGTYVEEDGRLIAFTSREQAVTYAEAWVHLDYAVAVPFSKVERTCSSSSSPDLSSSDIGS